MNNTSSNRHIEFRDGQYTIPEVMRKFVVQNLDEETFRQRLINGWSVEDIFFAPYYSCNKDKVPIYLAASGGFAREVAYVLSKSIINFEDINIIYLSDDVSQKNTKMIFGVVAGTIEGQVIKKSNPRFLAPVGSPSLRESLVERMRKSGYRDYGPAIHPQSFVGDAEIGKGSIICSMCSITTNVKIGQFVNVNLNCTIGHDAVIEDYVNLSPHCTISGKVHIKKGADLGSAVSVLPGVTIGENSIIGAGAVVTKDIPANVVAVGMPAKIIKEIK